MNSYQYPPLDLLNRQEPSSKLEDVEVKKRQIAEVFHAYKIEVKEINVTIGPSVSMYEIVPYLGINYRRVRSNEDDISISLGYPNLRILIPIPGKSTIGIELPNENKVTIPLGVVLSSKQFQETLMKLPCAIGKTIQNNIFMFDLAKTTNLLVAGSTGQGKTACLNAIICSLLYKKTPSELQLVLIDPKRCEFNIYAPLYNHFLAKLSDEGDAIVSEPGHCLSVMKSLQYMMDNRYDILKEADVRNIAEYNQKHPKERMPYVVTIIDELGDLMMTLGKEFESSLSHLATLGRCVGILFVICTQRPTTNIISGWIKANFSGRIAFRVSSRRDSLTILDRGGAECLNGRGDMLAEIDSPDPVRIQGAYIGEDEVEKVVSHITKQEWYASSKNTENRQCLL